MPNKTISVKNYGTIHHYAICRGCNWSNGIKNKEKNRSQQLRNRVFKHIRKTGHTIDVEAGTSRTYSLTN